MRKQLPAVFEPDERDRELIDVRVIKASVDLAQNLAVMKEQSLGSESLIDDGKVARGRGGRGIEPIGVIDDSAVGGAVQAIYGASSHPVDQFIAAPLERPGIGGGYLKFTKLKHARLVWIAFVNAVPFCRKPSVWRRSWRVYEDGEGVSLCRGARVRRMRSGSPIPRVKP